MPTDQGLAALLRGIPQDATGPVFREPWEATAFAIVVNLHQDGHFTWAEWVSTINAEIVRAQANGDPDTGSTYYHHWLAALEKIVLAKNLANATDLRLRRIETAANALGHIHKARRDPVRVA